MNKNGQITIARSADKGTSAESHERRHLRLSLYLPLEYSFMESSRIHLAYMANIWKDGLLMCTPQDLDIGQTLKIKIYYDSAERLDYVHTLGEVIRIDKLEKSEKGYRCAVRFVNPHSNSLKRCRKILMSH